MACGRLMCQLLVAVPCVSGHFVCPDLDEASGSNGNLILREPRLNGPTSEIVPRTHWGVAKHWPAGDA